MAGLNEKSLFVVGFDPIASVQSSSLRLILNNTIKTAAKLNLNLNLLSLYFRRSTVAKKRKKHKLFSD